MESYKDAAHVVSVQKPHLPTFCIKPHMATIAAQWFLANFPGDTFYAVKANPSIWLLKALHAAGLRKFEVASLSEVRLIAELFGDSEIAYMHPVKPREAIAEAYCDHGVRIFSLDSAAELDKILSATGAAKDLTLCLRHSVPNDSAKISLSRKFGASGDEAAALLQRMRQVSDRIGVAFHVGSQTMSPDAYVHAIDIVEETIIRAGVIIDILDVGGGFPAAYPGITPPPLIDFTAAIERRFEKMLVAENCALWCEPGRALCAETASLLLRVEGRRDDSLYVNDGAYGALFDARHLSWPFPARCVTQKKGPVEVVGFSLYGPTCDDLDHIPGPFYLPQNINESDYIEIGVIGAYGVAMSTRFNGFGAYLEFETADAPMTSVYQPFEVADKKMLGVISV